jgi:hypothetical protein
MQLSVYTYGILKYNQMELRSSDKKTTIRYKPNENFNLGLGFTYKWMGLGGAFNLKFINNDEAIYGNTTSLDMQLDLFTRRMLMTVNLQAYEGYYWRDPDQYYSNWSTLDSVVIRPDITSFGFNTSGIYVFKHEKFSLRAAYSNTEWQQISAGSWIMGAYASLYAVNADSSLIPGVASSSFPVYSDINKIAAANLGGLFGYSQSWVLKRKFYINLTGALGIALQISGASDRLDTDPASSVGLAPKLHLRLAAGFNNERYFYGISVISDNSFIPNKESAEFSYQFGRVRFFYGIHFGNR